VQVGELADLVDEHRASVAALLLIRSKHEVVERKLAASLEEVEQADSSVRTLEPVVLGDLVHRLAPPLCREPVALAHVGLLLRQQLLVRALPLLLRYDIGEIHSCLLHGRIPCYAPRDQ
jgi:hypothetical protein